MTQNIFTCMFVDPLLPIICALPALLTTPPITLTAVWIEVRRLTKSPAILASSFSSDFSCENLFCTQQQYFLFVNCSLPVTAGHRIV